MQLAQIARYQYLILATPWEWNTALYLGWLTQSTKSSVVLLSEYSETKIFTERKIFAFYVVIQEHRVIGSAGSWHSVFKLFTFIFKKYFPCTTDTYSWHIQKTQCLTLKWNKHLFRTSLTSILTPLGQITANTEIHSQVKHCSHTRGNTQIQPVAFNYHWLLRERIKNIICFCKLPGDAITTTRRCYFV